MALITNQFLNNLKLTYKLGLSFGLVVILTFVMAVIGWSSIKELSQHSDSLYAVSELDSSHRQLNQSISQFRTLRDSQSKAAVDAELALLAQRSQALADNLEQAEQTQARNVLQAGNSFNQGFQDFAQATEARLSLERSQTQSAAAALKAVEGLDAALSQLNHLAPEQQLRLTLAASEAARQFLSGRHQLMLYLLTRNMQMRERGIELQSQALRSIEQLSKQVYGGSNALQEAHNALKSYLDSHPEVTAAFERENAALESMERAQQQMLSLSHELKAQLLTQRTQIAQRVAISMIVTALLTLLLASWMAWAMTKQITTPIRAIITHINRIASGDLSNGQPIVRMDELGDLMRSMQRMRLSLRQLVENIRSSSEQICSAANTIGVEIEQTRQGANKQSIETDSVASAVQEMSLTVQEVARNAEQASQAANEADREAQAGNRVVAEALQQVSQLANEMERSSDAVLQLRSDGEKIGAVLDVIKAVAEQTNLLALNAAIEAARAGEAGRGFAVVADEVRALAQRTQTSTAEIQGLISSLQQSSQNAARMMDNSRVLSTQTLELSQQASHSLDNITSTVSSIQSMNLQIAAAAEEQSAVAEEIAKSVVNVRDISEQTASASDRTAQSSEQMDQLGRALENQVNAFRL